VNCTVTGNSAREGGGVCAEEFGTWVELINCTVAGNSATNSAGGTYSHKGSCGMLNCIVYFNDAPTEPNDSGIFGPSAFEYSCITPLPTNGVGNIDADPRFVNAAAGDFRLRPDSPCIDAGTNLSDVITTDIVGEFRPWDGNRDGAAAFDMGAYEFRPSPVTLYVSLQSTNPTPPYTSWITAATNIQDAVDAARDGDTVVVTNGVYAVGWRDPLDSLGYGLGPSRVAVTNAIRLESLNGPLVTTIQGGQLTNDVGEAYGVRCVFLGINAVLSGFTLANGSTANEWQSERSKGGGVRSEPFAVVTNCVLTSNWAYFGGGGAAGGMLRNCSLIGNSAYHFGGGAYESTLYNCMITGNSAHPGDPGPNSSGSLGGGAYRSTLYNCRVTDNSARHAGGVVDCTLYNCTVTGNSATEFSGGGAGSSTLFNCTVTGNSASTQGGGVVNGRLYNCIVYYNIAANDPNYCNDYSEWGISYCCTTPLPTNGIGNVLGPPLFVDMVADDLRLREGSPCIDVGMNLVGFSATVTNWDG